MPIILLYMKFGLHNMKLIEDELFSFLKLITLIHSAGSAVKISSFKTIKPAQSITC